MPLKTFIIQFFTWWNGQTLGTRLLTWRKGEFVGEDAFGNRYYRRAQKNHHTKERRWVIYDGLAEPSKIPPGWYGWMHHRVGEPPTGREPSRDWIKPHQPNLTGTDQAYRPKGSLSSPTPRPSGPGDYEPWTPN